MRSHLLAVTVLLGAPSLGLAQDHKGDVFGGYSLVRSDGHNLQGAELSLGYRLGGPFGLVLDAAANKASIDGADVTTSSLLAGPRFSFGSGRVAPWVHALLGVVHTKAGIEAFGVEISESSNDPGAAVGGGVDFALGAGRWAIRAQADYRLVSIEADGERSTEGDPRFALGAVLRFGRP